MNSYDFSALNDKEFEELVRDLVSKDLGIKLRSFKKGKDKGIDIRFSSVSNINDVIIQAKHLVESGFKELIQLLKKEKEKLDKMNVGTYYIATSVKLLPQHETAIVSLLSPYIKSGNQIYSRERLNQLLSCNSNIEIKYFKLWITSTTVLARMLNNAAKGRSEYYAEKIKKDIKKYVQTKSLKDAIGILRKYKYLLITGQPGVGKSTLADIIVYSFLAKGFEPIIVDRNIREAEELVSPDPKAKQIFYLDDFLGDTYFAVLNPKSSDNAIVNFLKRIIQTKNKFLILSTRTTILNSAYQVYEKFNHSNMDLARKELELKDYTDFDKARILYNHIYQSNLQRSEVDTFFENRNYLKIIKHKNFNPRLIESITDRYKFSTSEFNEILEYALYTLNNPAETWKQSFTNQIKEEDRFLLFTLFSLSGTVQENVLECAFNRKVDYEIKNSGFTRKVDLYHQSLKRLLDGHITRNKYGDMDIFTLSFINPSLKDYLSHYLLKSKEERKKIIISSTYIEQVEYIFDSVLVHVYVDGKSTNEQKEFFIWLEEAKLSSMYNYDEMTLELLKCKRLNVLIKIGNAVVLKDRIDGMAFKILQIVKFEEIVHYKFLDLIWIVLEENLSGGLVEKFIIDYWDRIMKCLWANVFITEDTERIVALFEKYEIDFKAYMLETPNRTTVRTKITEVLHQKISDEVSYNKGSIVDEEMLNSFKQEMETIWKGGFLLVDLIPDKLDFENYLEDLKEEEYEENTKTDKETKSVLDAIAAPSAIQSPKRQKNYDKQIEALFNKF